MLQELGIGLLRLKDDVSSAAAGDLQVAALRSRGHSVCRPLVSSILPFVSRSGRAVVERGVEVDHTTVCLVTILSASEFNDMGRRSQIESAVTFVTMFEPFSTMPRDPSVASSALAKA